MADQLTKEPEPMGERLWSRGVEHIELELPERRLESPRELDL